MKTLNIYLLAFLMGCAFLSKAQTSNNPAYVKAMEETLVQLDTATTIPSLQKCKNMFERITQLEPEQWIPLYYVAYCEIRSVFANPQSNKAAMFLDNSKQKISKLKENKAADRSEAETLEGLHGMAMITLDPQANGQKYFSEVIGSLKKAEALNPENPRPRALFLFFNAQLPDFIKQDINEEEEAATISALFEKETKGTTRPYWGKEYLQMLRKE